MVFDIDEIAGIKMNEISVLCRSCLMDDLNDPRWDNQVPFLPDKQDQILKTSDLILNSLYFIFCDRCGKNLLSDEMASEPLEAVDTGEDSGIPLD